MRNDRSRLVGLYKLYAYNYNSLLLTLFHSLVFIVRNKQNQTMYNYKFDVKNNEITYWRSNAQY